MLNVDSKGSNHADEWYFSDFNWDDDFSLPVNDNRPHFHRFLGNQWVGNRSL